MIGNVIARRHGGQDAARSNEMTTRLQTSRRTLESGPWYDILVDGSARQVRQEQAGGFVYHTTYGWSTDASGEERSMGLLLYTIQAL